MPLPEPRGWRRRAAGSDPAGTGPRGVVAGLVSSGAEGLSETMAVLSGSSEERVVVSGRGGRDGFGSRRRFGPPAPRWRDPFFPVSGRRQRLCSPHRERGLCVQVPAWETLGVFVMSWSCSLWASLTRNALALLLTHCPAGS